MPLWWRARGCQQLGTRKDRFLPRTTLSPDHSWKSSCKNTTDQTGRQNSLNQLPPGTPQGFSPRVPTFRAREGADSVAPTMPAKATGSESQERQNSLSFSFLWFILIYFEQQKVLQKRNYHGASRV